MSDTIQTATNRIEWIDLARGLGVILVILGHMDLGDGITAWIYSFHMPLFFFLSGLVFRVKDGETFPEFAARKAKALLIPYFLLGLPLLLSEYVKAIYAGTFNPVTALEWIARFLLQRRLWTIWFLTALFVCELIMYWIAQIRDTKNAALLRFLTAALLSGIGVTYCLICGTYVVWDIDMALCAMLWMEVGYELKVADLPARVGGWTKSRLAIAALAGLAVNLVCSGLSKGISGQTLMMSYNSYGVPALTYTGAFGGIALVVMASVLLYEILGAAKHRPISYIGKNTWIYFAWNQTLLLPLINWILAEIGFDAGTFYSTGWWLHRLIELAFVMIISTICTIIGNKMKPMINCRRIR